MNSSSAFSRRNSIKRRAAAEAETKIKKLADDEAKETGKELEGTTNPSKETIADASCRPLTYQERKQKGSTHNSFRFSASPLMSSSNPLHFSSSSASSAGIFDDAGTISSISGASCDTDPENGVLRGTCNEIDCSRVEISAHAETRAALDKAFGIDSAMKERIAHQRRRAKRQINSSGTMHLSRNSRHRIHRVRRRNPNDICDDDLSPIVARTLELTSVANIPTTPASRYGFSSALATYVEAPPFANAAAASSFITSSSVPKRTFVESRCSKLKGTTYTKTPSKPRRREERGK
jgi:hypothetical protein